MAWSGVGAPRRSRVANERSPPIIELEPCRGTTLGRGSRSWSASVPQWSVTRGSRPDSRRAPRPGTGEVVGHADAPAHAWSSLRARQVGTHGWLRCRGRANLPRMSQRLPWPKEPAQFEELCRALWASMDKGRAWQRLGRSGQSAPRCRSARSSRSPATACARAPTGAGRLLHTPHGFPHAPRRFHTPPRRFRRHTRPSHTPRTVPTRPAPIPARPARVPTPDAPVPHATRGLLHTPHGFLHAAVPTAAAPRPQAAAPTPTARRGRPRARRWQPFPVGTGRGHRHF